MTSVPEGKEGCHTDGCMLESGRGEEEEEENFFQGGREMEWEQWGDPGYKLCEGLP